MRQAWFVVAATLALLLPFIAKPVHLDDTLFLYTARQIHQEPLDFYGFDINWYGYPTPMAETAQNPPAAAYYQALLAVLGGWSEAVLHGGFLLPALAFAWGTFLLARRFCARPALAALIAVATPAFLVSATGLMSDVPMLALYVWAILLWRRGLERRSFVWLLAAAVAITAAALTKYFGVTLVPLLFAYTCLRERRIGAWVAPLLLPLVVLVGYEFWVHARYGVYPILGAARYATERGGLFPGRGLAHALIGLSFTGGLMAPMALFLPVLRLRRWVYALPLFAIAAVTLLVTLPETVTGLTDVWPRLRVIVLVQYSLFVVAGLIVLALAMRDLIHRWDADSALLAMWLVGTFVFATWLNWSVTARTILPMAPVAGMLIARRLDEVVAERGEVAGWRLAWPLAPALLLALTVAGADQDLAESSRDAAATFAARARQQRGAVFFQGHWGFQYYMEAAGFHALDHRNGRVRPGDVVIFTANNSSVQRLAAHFVAAQPTFEFVASRWVSTFKGPVGAGFYSSLWGPLPFAFGPVPPDRYFVAVMSRAGNPITGR